MKYKDFLAEEELKHKLYTKEEMRDLRAKSKEEAQKEEGEAPENGTDPQKSDDENKNDDSNEDVTDSIIAEIKTALKDVTEDTNIVTDADIYIAKQDAKEYLGYFVYKKEIGDEQDDFYVGKFIYRVSEQKLESLIDDIDESFKNLSEAEAYIKSYKGVKA